MELGYRYFRMCGDWSVRALVEPEVLFGDVSGLFRLSNLKVGLLSEGRVIPVTLRTAGTICRSECERELAVLVDEGGVRVIERCPEVLYSLETMSREALVTYIVGEGERKSTWVTTYIADEAQMGSVVDLARAIERLGKDELNWDSVWLPSFYE